MPMVRRVMETEMQAQRQKTIRLVVTLLFLLALAVVLAP